MSAPHPTAAGTGTPDEGGRTGSTPAAERRTPTGRAHPDRSLDTLAACRRYFLAKATPRIIIPLLVLVAVLRVREGGFGWGDVLVVAGILAFEPFTEWLIHVHLLHFRPRTWHGHRVDLHAARKHREHHRNPGDPNTAFVPLPDLFGLGLIGVGIFGLLTRDHAHLLTAELVGLAMLLTYEWTHFLIHTSYKPQGRYYRYIWRAHRWHHYKNEHYWMGVTVHLADHLLGTFPDKSEVETSKTARTLGVDE